MSTHTLRVLFTAVAALATASAQPSVSGTARDPLDANASAPSLTHRSALSGYRSAHDVRVVPWRDANDTVTRVGGWRVYLREAGEPEAAPPSDKAAPSSAAPSSSAPASAPTSTPASAPARSEGAPSAAPSRSDNTPAPAPARPATTPSGGGHGRHGTH